MEKHSTPTSRDIIQFNESAIQGHRWFVTAWRQRSTRCWKPKRPDVPRREDQRSEAPQGQPGVGFYQRKLHTKAGE